MRRVPGLVLPLFGLFLEYHAASVAAEIVFFSVILVNDGQLFLQFNTAHGVNGHDLIHWQFIFIVCGVCGVLHARWCGILDKPTRIPVRAFIMYGLSGLAAKEDVGQAVHKVHQVVAKFSEAERVLVLWGRVCACRRCVRRGGLSGRCG